MAEPLFRLEGIRKYYQGRLVLDIPALAITGQGITALEGPNGSGKTTLLMILAALLRPERGRLWYRGRPVEEGGMGLTRYRRQVTLVAQDAYLFNGTVEANLAYGPGLRGWGRRRRRRAALEALGRVGLEGFMGRRARELSQGERQRVALARALALEPRVLLLDEPFANLDPASSRVFEEVISRLPQEGCRVILVTHTHEQALRLAGEVLALAGGRLAGAG